MLLNLILVLDSSSKIPSGILMGNFIDLGMVDECLNVRKTLLDSSNRSREIRGRQCMYSANFTINKVELPAGLRLSICMPSSCEAKDVQTFLHSRSKMIEIFIQKYLKLQIAIDSTECTPIDNDFWDLGLIVVS